MPTSADALLYNNHHSIQHAVLVYLNAAKYFSNIFLLPALASPCAILGKSDFLAEFSSLLFSTYGFLQVRKSSEIFAYQGRVKVDLCLLYAVSRTEAAYLRWSSSFCLRVPASRKPPKNLTVALQG